MDNKESELFKRTLLISRLIGERVRIGLYATEDFFNQNRDIVSGDGSGSGVGSHIYSDYNNGDGSGGAGGFSTENGTGYGFGRRRIAGNGFGIGTRYEFFAPTQ